MCSHHHIKFVIEDEYKKLFKCISYIETGSLFAAQGLARSEPAKTAKARQNLQKPAKTGKSPPKLQKPAKTAKARQNWKKAHQNLQKPAKTG